MTEMKAILCMCICGLVGCMCQLAFGQGKSRPIKTSVCEMSASPSRFTGKMVVFSGHYESDGVERSVVTDDNCKEVGIAISIPDHFHGEDDLNKALSVGRPGTLDKIVEATFVGQFRWNPHENPKRILRLKEIRDLTSTMK